MRFALLGLALALAACAPEQVAETCDLTATRAIAFTPDGAQENVIARTIGPSCDKAIGLYVVTSEDHHPIWAWTAPMSRAFGDAYRPASPEEAQAFLDRWAQPETGATGAAPAWTALADDPREARTTLDQLTYEDIRARDLPMLCHVTGVARETCVFWEPGAAAASSYLERDVAAAGETP
ncbi:MAG: hypothetical protein WDM79_08890 [Terricaulis sp.]